MNIFEGLGFLWIVFSSSLGTSLFLYCTWRGMRQAWRRLVEDEQKGPFAVVQSRAANE